MISKKKQIGEKLSVLAKTIGISQSTLAEKVGAPPSQINRFFRGHSEIYSAAFLKILKELGFDIEEAVSKRLKSVSELEIASPKDSHEALIFLFNELDDLGKQTFLTQLLWAAKTSKGDLFPKNIEEQIRKEISLI